MENTMRVLDASVMNKEGIELVIGTSFRKPVSIRFDAAKLPFMAKQSLSSVSGSEMTGYDALVWASSFAYFAANARDDVNTGSFVRLSDVLDSVNQEINSVMAGKLAVDPEYDMAAFVEEHAGFLVKIIG